MLAPSVSTTLDQLLHHVERFGIAASAAEIASLAVAARTHGVPAAVIEVLVDEAASDLVRERALARATADLRVMAPAITLVAA